MEGGQRPLPWGLGWRGRSVSGGKGGFRGRLGGMRGAWGPALSPSIGAGVGMGYAPSLRRYRPRPARDSGRGPTRRHPPSHHPPRTLPPAPPRETKREWTVRKSPEIQAHRSPARRPRAGRPSPPVHFVDTRAHLWALDCFTAPVFYSVSYILISREGYFYLLVLEDVIPVILLVRQVSTWMRNLVFRNIYIVRLTPKVNFRERE